MIFRGADQLKRNCQPQFLGKHCWKYKKWQIQAIYSCSKVARPAGRPVSQLPAKSRRLQQQKKCPMTLRFFRLRKRGLISPAYWSVLRRTVTTSITYLNLTRLLSPFLYSKYHSGQYKGQINFSGQSGEPIICGPPPFNCI